MSNDNYVLRCMYLDLRDLVHNHSLGRYKNSPLKLTTTPEMTLLESRIENQEMNEATVSVIELRSRHCKKLKEVERSMKFHSFANVKLNVTYEKAVDFFFRLEQEEYLAKRRVEDSTIN